MKFQAYADQLDAPSDNRARLHRSADAHNIALLYAHTGLDLDLSERRWNALLTELRNLPPEGWRDVFARGKVALSSLAPAPKPAE